MGILPLEFTAGETAASLGLTGEETFTIEGLADAIPTRKVDGARQAATTGRVVEFGATVRIDTPQEREYYRHGGILQYVLRQLLKS